jgi:hypothetical protein
MSKPKNTPTCHPDRKHQAKGLCQECYSKMRWQLQTVNREKANTASREYYARNKEKITRKIKERYLKDPVKRIAKSIKNKEWIRDNPEYVLWKCARLRAKKRGLAFNLDRSDICIPSHCPVLGIPLITGSGKFAHNSPSIDRIDNNGGYTKDNILVVSFRALEELEKVTQFYKNLPS